MISIFTVRVRSTREGNIYTWKRLSVHFWGGGPMSQIFGGVPCLRFWGGSQVSDFQGGSQVSDFRGGGPGLRFSGGGYPVSVKGKIFDTRFGLIHVQTGKKIFVEGPPPPPPSKGKNF